MPKKRALTPFVNDEHQLVEFKYDVNRQRYHKQTTRAGMTTETHYVGQSYERLSVNHNVQHKHYIYAGGALVAIHTEHDAGSVETNTTRYVHKDHLGSTDALSNEQGDIVERMSYDAWGQRRSSDWQADDTPQPDTNRGYTGHEHIDELGIIHMNGRVYDPKIARFLSADPFIPDVNNLQSHNRYAYVMNNPLNATDPSGFFFKKITNAFKKVAKSVSSAVSGALQNRWVRMGLAMYGAYMTGGMINGAYASAVSNAAGHAAVTGGIASVGISATTAATLAGAAGGFTGAMIMSGGDIRAGVLGGMTGGAAGFIGASSAFGAAGTTTTGRVVAHGTVGGVSSELSGGNFKDGFVSSAFTKTVSSPLSDITHNNPVAGSIAASVVGGTASVLSGGKFHNAALTSGFQYMFNEAMSRAQRRQSLRDRHNARYAENDAKLREYGLYGRGDLTIDQIQRAGPEFSQSSRFESQLHGEGNLKFTSNDPGRNWWNRYGRTEFVVSPNNDGTYTHVQDANMGTLNYGHNPISHTILDVVPHMFWGHPK